jgi:hypothetical protein
MRTRLVCRDILVALRHLTSPTQFTACNSAKDGEQERTVHLPHRIITYKGKTVSKLSAGNSEYGLSMFQILQNEGCVSGEDQLQHILLTRSKVFYM